MRRILILRSSDDSHGTGGCGHEAVAQLSQLLEDEETYHGPGLALSARHGNSLFSSIIQEVVSTLEPLVELRDAPGRDDLDGWLQGVESQLFGVFLSKLLLSFCEIFLPRSELGRFPCLSPVSIGTLNDEPVQTHLCNRGI